MEKDRWRWRSKSAGKRGPCSFSQEMRKIQMDFESKEVQSKRLTLAYGPIHNHQHGPSRMTSTWPKFYHSSSKRLISGPFHKSSQVVKGVWEWGAEGCKMEFTSLFIIGRIKRENGGNPDNSAEIEKLHKLWEKSTFSSDFFQNCIGHIIWTRANMLVYSLVFSLMKLNSSEISPFLIPAFQVRRALCHTWRGGGVFILGRPCLTQNIPNWSVFEPEAPHP